ncbi:MAG: S8 family serine peptidase, partial [Anaerolineae bacterium]
MPEQPMPRQAAALRLSLTAWGLMVVLAGPRNAAARPEGRGVAPQGGTQKVVMSAVARDGSAPALLLLGADTSSSRDDAAVAAAVGRVQDEVLASMPRGAFSVTHRYTLIPALGGEVTSRGLDALAADPRVVAIELAVEDVPFLAEHVEVVEGREAWGAYGLTGDGVTVAVLDTGIDTDHPDLKDDIVAQQCYSQAGGCGGNNATRGPSAEDEAGHGTSVSGIITSGGMVSAPGIAPDAGIAAVRVFNDQVTADTRDIVLGLDWVLGNRNRYNIKVVNMSLGSTATYKGNCDSQDQTRAEAVNQLVRRGVTVVAASGNGSRNNGMSAPACLSGVLAVGATYDDDFPRSPPRGTFGDGCFDENTTPAMVACFSNVSRSLDVVAPGVWT